ncbi:O-antigen ligase family protein [Nocardioides seonyuensis]|uniref:O-antigen ligase family protein n=1 Tax=Nocardioides seonyuensis TaxID=2518371 RepID=A0A4V1BMC3_9ACTN|nr:O-antigen ligase family protein [Nocardioides seonyuensis]QBX55872.1 O-antigen ligase family protein [Nocardioides seonyuensis]
MSLELMSVLSAFTVGVMLTGVGRLQVACGGLFFSVFVLPVTLFGSTVIDRYRVGITGAEPQIATYTVVVLLVLLMALLLRGPSPDWATVMPFLVFMAVWSVLVWPHTGEVRAGVLHLGIACLAWVAGTYVAKQMQVHPRGPRILLTWLLVIVALQAAVAIAQTQGVEVFPTAASVILEDDSLEGRAGATLGHPSSIGKMMFLVLLIVLPWLATDQRGLRRVALWIVLLAIIPLGLSGGRANAVACVATVLLFVLLDPGRRRWSNRLQLFVLVLAGVFSTWNIWVRRFATGENGEFRARFFQTAVDFLSDAPPWQGTGANTYVTAVGPTDQMAAIGWVVHNVYLFAAVELGVLGAAIFFLPFVQAWVRGWAARRRQGVAGAYGRVLVASAPGLLLITWTGWGMMARPLVPWMLVTGFAYTLARGQNDDEEFGDLSVVPPVSAATASSTSVGGSVRS